MFVAVIIIEILIIFLLVRYIKHVREKFNHISKSKKRLEELTILKELVEVSASNKSSKAKIDMLNNVILKNFNITYSSIVMYDGDHFNVLTSNVSKNLYKHIVNYYKNDVFKDAVTNGKTIKLVTKNNQDKLSHLIQEFDRVKSTIFFPISWTSPLTVAINTLPAEEL